MNPCCDETFEDSYLYEYPPYEHTVGSSSHQELDIHTCMTDFDYDEYPNSKCSGTSIVDLQSLVLKSTKMKEAKHSRKCDKKLRHKKRRADDRDCPQPRKIHYVNDSSSQADFNDTETTDYVMTEEKYENESEEEPINTDGVVCFMKSEHVTRTFLSDKFKTRYMEGQSCPRKFMIYFHYSGDNLTKLSTKDSSFSFTSTYLLCRHLDQCSFGDPAELSTQSNALVQLRYGAVLCIHIN